MLEAIFEMSCLSFAHWGWEEETAKLVHKISRGKSSNSNGDVESTKLVQEVQEKNQNFFLYHFFFASANYFVRNKTEQPIN